MGETPTTHDGVPLIDPRAHQFQLSIAAALNLVAAARRSPWPLYAGATLFAVASPGFPRRSPLVRAWGAIADRVSPPRVLIDARPAGVMSALSVPSFLVPAVAFSVGHRRSAMVTAVITGVGLAIEAAVGRCVTCESYRWLADHGVLTPSPPLVDSCIVVPVS